MVKTVDWNSCYDDNWNGVIVPEAFAHPAKFAHGLIRRIVSHGLAQGYWKKGDLLGDPFGGVALGGIVCGYAGLNWIGVELEPRFVELGNRNLALHGPKWMTLGEASYVKLVQGDSREFAKIVAVQMAGVLSSPPYAGNEKADYLMSEDGKTRKRDEKRGFRQGHGCFRGSEGAYGQEEGQIGSLPTGDLSGVLTSPPYAETAINPAGNFQSHKCPDSKPARDVRPAGYADGVVTSPPWSESLSSGKLSEEMKTEMRSRGHKPSASGESADYGQTSGQIGALPAGQVDAVISSPPYAETVKGEHGETETAAETRAKRRTEGGSLGQSQRHGGYGVSDGQIGALKDDGLDGVVTSPPWEKGAEGGLRGSKFKDPAAFADAMSAADGNGNRHSASPEARQAQLERDASRVYGTSEGQLGNASGETYWQAMAQVYDQMRLAMRPGAIAAIVVKAYVKNKQIVPLPDQTMQLLSHLGFRPVERIRAWLVKDTEHVDLFDGKVTKRKERKSFFRRLSEKRGSPRIDYECVLIVRKPESASTLSNDISPSARASEDLQPSTE